MSEPIAETEKQIIRAELMAEKKKRKRNNEQDPEQGNDDRIEQEVERLRKEVARIEKEKSEVEELLRRSEEARIELERKMKQEQEERQIREEDARLERANIQKELEMLREKTANFEKEREEAEEREREKENARIERARIEAQEKKREEVERRLMNERSVFPFLALPRELQCKIYPHFDLEARRALRIIEELEEIEMKTKYRYERLEITITEEKMELTVCKAHGGWSIVMVCSVPHSEVETELEIMAKNTQLDFIIFKSNISDNRQITNAMKSLNTREIRVLESPRFNDSDLQSILHNREEVCVYDHNITESGLFWIYEKMRDRQLDLKDGLFECSKTIRYNFLDKFGTFDRETLVLTGTNPNQMVRDTGPFVFIHEGELKIVIDKRDEDGEIGTVSIVYKSD